MPNNIEQAADQLIADQDLFHQIVHGDDTVEVTTESGQRKSLAGEIKEKIILPNNDTAANVTAAQTAETGAQTAETNSLANKNAAAVSETNSAASEAAANQHKLDAEAAQVGAETALAGAQVAESNTVAVSTGGTASLPAAAGKIPIADAEGKIDLDWLLPVQTKAEFDAARAQRKEQYAGSGFVEMGHHYDEGSTYQRVNQGMWQWITSAEPNSFRIGDDVLGSGESKTHSPTVTVDGVLLSIQSVKSTAEKNLIRLPDAPIATNLLDNGGFDTDLTGWTIEDAVNNTCVSVGGVLSITGTNDYSGVWQEKSVTAGHTYQVQWRVKRDTTNGFQITASLDGGASVNWDDGSNSGTSITDNEIIGNFKIFTKYYTAPSSGIFRLRPNQGANVSEAVEYDDIVIMDMGDVNRTDLVFLEVWHEKITDKDVIYPYGNVQYGITTYEGITLSNTVEVQGYSALGDWDTITKGNGVIFSTLTAADKAKFIQDPLNNIYLDDGELIQVRYRVRVVKGLGDSWDNVSETTVGNNYFKYTDATARVKPHGSKTSLAKDLDKWDGGFNGFYIGHDYGNGYQDNKPDIGAFVATSGSVGGDMNSYAHTGALFAIPIALVTRRNQGAYHPVLNPRGTGAIAKADEWGRLWYTAAAGGPETYTTFDCFDLIPGNAHYGVIGNPYWDARPDSKYYDAVYADDIQDLRNKAAKPTDLNRTLSKYFQQAVAGELRGSEGANIAYYDTTIASQGTNWIGITESVVGSDTNLDGPNGLRCMVIHQSRYYYAQKKVAWGGWYLFDDPDFQTASNTDSMTSGPIRVVLWARDGYTRAYYSLSSGRIMSDAKSSGEILCCDIIGDPANYFRGHYTYIDTSGAETNVNQGEVLYCTGANSNGIAGHFYERISTYVGAWNTTTDGLSGFKDLGTDRPGSWVTDGVFGTPLLVHPDTGVSLIPDGTSKEFKVSRKVSNVELVLYSQDNGNTWAVTTSTWDTLLEGSTNARTHNPTSDFLYLMFYSTKANCWESAANAEALALGDVWASAYSLDSYSGGVNLISALINKVGIATGGTARLGSSLLSYRKSIDNTKLYQDGNTPGPIHDALDIGTVASPAAKALPYLTRENGRLYLQALFKEMRFDYGADAPTEFISIDGATGQAYTAGLYYQIASLDTPVAVMSLVTATMTFAAYTETAEGWVDNAGTLTFVRWDGNGWGDDDKFDVVDNVSAVTDDNGNTILVGQKRIELPFFIGDDE